MKHFEKEFEFDGFKGPSKRSYDVISYESPQGPPKSRKPTGKRLMSRQAGAS